MKYPHIAVQLTGKDGNASAIIGAVDKAMHRAKCSQTQIEEFLKEATSGDYNHLLQTCMNYVNVK